MTLHPNLLRLLLLFLFGLVLFHQLAGVGIAAGLEVMKNIKDPEEIVNGLPGGFSGREAFPFDQVVWLVGDEGLVKDGVDVVDGLLGCAHAWVYLRKNYAINEYLYISQKRTHIKTYLKDPLLFSSIPSLPPRRPLLPSPINFRRFLARQVYQAHNIAKGLLDVGALIGA